MPTLTSAEKSALRARAHDLNPVVSIAESGLTEAVLKEIDTCLKAHELIKIRVYGDDREARAGYLATICEQLGAAAVQQIGKLLVVWRPLTEAEKAAKNPVRHRRAAPRRTKRSFQNDR